MAILTITKQYGSGGGVIGHAVASLLGYEYIPLHRIFEEAEKAGGELKRIAEEVSKGVPGLWEQTDWSFLAFAAFSQSIILKYSLRNNVVVMTRGGNILLRNIPHVLRIFMTAPFEARVQRIVEREEVSPQIAAMMARKADREMAVTIQQVEGANWMDPTEYDRVVDTSRKDWDAIAGSLKNDLLEREKAYSKEAQKLLDMKALATRIKVKIMTSPGFLVPTLEIEMEDDVLVVRGVVRNPEQHKLIEQEIMKMAGNISVKCNLHYRGSWPFRGI